MNIKKLFQKSESGQITIVIIILVLIVGVFIVFQGQTTQIAENKTICYMNPDPSKSLSYQGATYELIREKSALSTEQFKWHMKDLETIQYGGSSRKLMRASIWSEAQAPYPSDPPKDPAEIAGFPPDAKDLLFLEVPNTVINAPGYIFVDIFLKKGVPVPDFIKQFCDEQHQPIDAIQIFPDATGKRFPPAYINAKDVNIALPAADYTLFAYERSDSDTGRKHRGPGTQGMVNIDGKNYPVSVVSYANYLGVFDEASGLIYLYSSKIDPPSPVPSGVDAKNSLQLRTFDVSTLYPWGWWSPECKPAVYLYPEKKSNIHVIVEPKGYLTYTDPKYPSGGWKVEAHPDGTIISSSKKYDYLYYESKIRDSEIEKPTKGYVVTFDELPKLYSEILPKLGLNEKETKDFKDYWEDVLPQSPYYFVGVMTEKSIDKIEPLTIEPKPQTIIRVRIYFEALNEKREVEAPELVYKKRNGFVVSEWGGIVKLHPGTEFSCSQ